MFPQLAKARDTYTTSLTNKTQELQSYIQKTSLTNKTQELQS